MMATSAQSNGRGGLTETEIHGVLSNRRRQMTLRLLGEAEDSMAVRDLSEKIASIETGQHPPPRNTRQSVYVSLIQTHLPRLDKLNVVEFDDGSKTVGLRTNAEEVFIVMETDPRAFSGGHYLILAFTGLLVIVASRGENPLLDPGVALYVAGLMILIIAGLAVYRTQKIGWPTLRRLRLRSKYSSK